MKKMKFLVLAAFVAAAVLMLAAGCATYNTKGAVPVLSRIEGKKVLRAERKGVVISVYPLMTAEETEKYFDENLVRVRVFGGKILAVYIDVSNKTATVAKVTLISLNVGGLTIAPTTVDRVYGAVKRDYSTRAFLWMFPTMFVGAPVSAVHTAVINMGIKEDLKEKQLEVGRDIKDSLSGFIFFEIPKKGLPDEELPRGMILNISLDRSLNEGGELIEFPIS